MVSAHKIQLEKSSIEVNCALVMSLSLNSAIFTFRGVDIISAGAGNFLASISSAIPVFENLNFLLLPSHRMEFFGYIFAMLIFRFFFIFCL